MYVLQYSPETIGMGPAVLLVGILGLLLGAAVVFRNPAGVVAWAFSLLLFVFSALFGIGTELVWLGIALTTVIVVIGVVARWSQ